MKIRLKNWITTIIGLLLLLFAVLLIWSKYEAVYIIITFAFGLGLIYAKDDLIKKLIGKL